MADQVQGVPAPSLPLLPKCKQDNRPNNNSKSPAPPAQQGQQIVALNLSHFKPEFSGKPDEDAEAHLLHTNNWMTTHHFVEGVKSSKILFNTIRRG